MLEKMIKWMTDRRGAVYYSMSYRNGQRINAAGVLSSSGRPGYDCSSAVYYSLVDAGFLPPTTWIGNTDSLYGDLERNGWTRLPLDASGNAKTQRGDIFLWGKRGASTGAFGHTGTFVDADNIIHCNYANNGITVNNHDAFWMASGRPEYAFYRYTGNPAPATGIQRGDRVMFAGSHQVEQRATVNGITQVAAKSLYIHNFDWTDNGIAVSGIAKVDKDGYWLSGITGVGERFVIPGAMTVNDVAADRGVSYALVTVGGYEVWVAVSALTEIGAGHAGKPFPSERPKPVDPPKPVEPEKPAEPEPEKPVEPEAPKEPIENQEPIEQPKEDEMAFSKEEAQEIKINSQAVLDANTEFTPIISDKVKTIAYFVTDTSAILSSLVLTVLAIFGQVDGVVAVTLSTAVSTALLGLKQTFRLSNKKQ